VTSASTRRAASVIIPVKDGARYLSEVLESVAQQRYDGEIEMLVVDSGSHDRSLDIARAAGARVLEIPPGSFGHGRTRNVAAEQARGECLAFLTQDATPASPQWLASLVGVLDEKDRVGLAFGPHLPRPDTPPMLARELEEFFGSFTDAEGVRVDEAADPAEPASGFFSNVNACILRSCWEEVRFRDVPYAEDQAFARDAFARGWRKAFVPAAGVLHAHDYPFWQFMRRYFDEYRGLRETLNHVEPLSPAALRQVVRRGVGGDLAYMRQSGYGRARRIAWAWRSGRHHGGRAVFSALGSRADRLPRAARERLSLEGRGDAGEGRPGGRQVRAAKASPYDYIRLGARGEPAPLVAPSPHDGEKPLLHLAWLIPPFRRGSGGHMTIFTIIKELEARGHSCSIWVHDPSGLMDRRAALAHRQVVEDFAPVRAGVFLGFEDWQGADVALATGWQTAYPLRSLGGCALKAYYVQDYEPEFYAASAERLWAEATYRMGYPCLASSPWLRDLVRERYGAQAESFEYGVDFDHYRPLDLPRRPDTILYYARPATPRRATELGVQALGELVGRRPGTRVVVFGDVKSFPAPFDYELAGVLPPEALARLYAEATMGLVISLTNYSLVPKEMMACGLPVVDVRGASIESVFGSGGEVIALAEPDVFALADELEALLDAPERRSRMAAAAQRFVAGMTWDATATTIERHLRAWLAERWSKALEEAQRGPSGERSALAGLAGLGERLT
jgi:glycosyltransferase involved in cell wall biosynthesis